MARIAIYGAGGLGRDLINPVLRQLDGYERLIFVDDENAGGELCGIPIHPLDELTSEDGVIISLGAGHHRQSMEQRCLDRGLTLRSFVAPLACVGAGNEIAPGLLVCDYGLIGAAVRIGRQFQCSAYSYVGHDCVIGDYVTFAPKVSCNGHVHIEDFAYIGTGAILKEGSRDKPLVIGRGATVGMGAVVTKSVPPGVTVIGNPARPMERKPAA